MGKLSRQRRQPRIVKKSRSSKQKRGLNPSKLNADLQRFWDKDKSPAQNFKNIGLTMNVKPSLRQTEEGKLLLSEARVKMNKTYYDYSGVTADTEIADTVNIEKL